MAARKISVADYAKQTNQSADVVSRRINGKVDLSPHGHRGLRQPHRISAQRLPQQPVHSGRSKGGGVMVRTYRLGGAERERARALIRILSIDMDRVRWLDGHPMTVRVFDDGKCWVEYTGLVVCDKEDIDFCLRGLEPVDVGPGSIRTGSGNAGTGFFARIRGCLSISRSRPSRR